MKKIEQVNNVEIIEDFDESLSVRDIKDILSRDLNISNNSNPFICSLNGKEIHLFVKQVTYLGHPHLSFKKRIQISKGWQLSLRDENSYLLGIYKYKETIIYTFFDKTNYINRITNNSSAHVSTFDLLSAQQKGIFTKKDLRGNIISTIRREFINNFLQKVVNNEHILSNEIILFENFKQTLRKEYHGIFCYTEMIEKNYINRFQPEWFAFYLEYKFANFLELNPDYKRICNYQSNKSKGSIDLDLNFNNEYFGDLKTHSNDTGAILGNDKNNIERAISLYGKLWYIVFNHDTYKDSEYEYEVTRFWNTVLKKEDLMSYSLKMKNNIVFTDFLILEINNYNITYLSLFKQGLNSNGLPREHKYKIDKKMISNFLIYSSRF